MYVYFFKVAQLSNFLTRPSYFDDIVLTAYSCLFILTSIEVLYIKPGRIGTYYRIPTTRYCVSVLFYLLFGFRY